MLDAADELEYSLSVFGRILMVVRMNTSQVTGDMTLCEATYQYYNLQHQRYRQHRLAVAVNWLY